MGTVISCFIEHAEMVVRIVCVSTIHRQPLDMSVNVMMLAQGTTGTVPHNGTYPCTSEGLVDGLAMPEGDVRVGLETYMVYLDMAS